MKYSLPLVSIGLPTFNRADDLRIVLEELLSQTYRNIEIIISNDASVDHTRKVCLEFAKKDSRIRYYECQKVIPAIENFNLVLNKARGSYFLWVSDDDKWDKRYVSTVMREYAKDKKEEILLITTKFLVMNQRGIVQQQQKRSFTQYKKKYIDLATFLKEDFSGYKADVFYGIYRTAYLKKLGGYNTLSPLAMSDILTIHTILCAGKLRLLNQKLFCKREFFLNAQARKFTDSFAEVFKFFRTIKNILVPSNFRYLLKHVREYYDFNKKLFQTYFPGNMTFHILNIYSSIQLFFHLAPNEIRFLKRRSSMFSGK